MNNNPTGGLDGMPPDDKSFYIPSTAVRMWWIFAIAQGRYGADNTAGYTQE